MIPAISFCRFCGWFGGERIETVDEILKCRQFRRRKTHVGHSLL